MESATIIQALNALAQETRLALFRLLVKRGAEGYTPSELAEKLALPGATLSFHLKELQAANLIIARRNGRFIFYSANYPAMRRVIGFLTENCCESASENQGTQKRQTAS